MKTLDQETILGIVLLIILLIGTYSSYFINKTYKNWKLKNHEKHEKK
jgi:preprotein translocase subunit SecF